MFRAPSVQRRVDMKSGGHLVIEPTEALVSIDVTTGHYEAEFVNVDRPGGDVDADVMVPAVRRVLDDLDRRFDEARKAGDEGQDEVHLYGDDTSVN